MKKIFGILFFSLFTFSCQDFDVIDTTPPASPRGIQTISLDNAVQLDWLDNTEPDLAGYRIWVSDRYDGKYVHIGTTKTNRFIDRGARNGVTYYYGLTAFDFNGNESEMSREVVYDTPRPEGYGVKLYNYRQYPSLAGYDFSTFSIGRYDDEYTDVFYEYVSGRSYLNVWKDTDIQDMGYTRTLDDISVAPSGGWSPSKSVEAIPGHTYVVWTWDDHYAKIRVTEVRSSYIVFDWAYQIAKGNPELKRYPTSGGGRNRTLTGTFIQ